VAQASRSTSLVLKLPATPEGSVNHRINQLIGMQQGIAFCPPGSSGDAFAGCPGVDWAASRPASHAIQSRRMAGQVQR
jgi:hypothetical protein